MKQINLKKKVVNIFLGVLAIMATVGANNYSIAGLHQPIKPKQLKL